MLIDWKNHMKSLSQPLKDLRGGAPEVMKGFSAIAQAALKANALDTKTKELIAIAIGVATRCDDCIAFHVKAAIEQGKADFLSLQAGQGAGLLKERTAQALMDKLVRETSAALNAISR